MQLVVLGELVQNLPIFWRVAEAFYGFVNSLTLEAAHVEAKEFVKMELEALLLRELGEHAAKFVHGLASFVLLGEFYL